MVRALASVAGESIIFVMSPSDATPPAEEWLVACLCADWCGVCRDYRPGFDALAREFAGARFAWIDIEDDAEAAGDHEVEDFPTLLVKRGDAVLFFGALQPHHSHLRRLLESFGVPR
jgi:thiol-disulfide isomerase/thioredoxin